MNASVMSILSRIDELDEKQIAEVVKRSNLFLNTRKVSEPAQATSSATSRGMKRKLKSRWAANSDTLLEPEPRVTQTKKAMKG